MSAKYRNSRGRIGYEPNRYTLQQNAPIGGRPKSKVVTLVEPSLETSIAEATTSCCAIVHTRSIQEAIFATRDRDVHALLVSPNALVAEPFQGIATLVGKCSSMMTVAVFKDHGVTASQGLIDLGGCGVRRLVDLSERDGWESLRELVSKAGEVNAQRILSAIESVVGDASMASRYFIENMVRAAPRIHTVRELAREFGVHPSSMMSRFFRHQLPAPKRYLAATRLLYASAHFEGASVSVADVAYRLNYSSPQSFGRHVKAMMGMTPGYFRYRFTMERMIGHFVDTLILPHREALRTFDPIGRGTSAARLGAEFAERSRNAPSGQAQSPHAV